MRLLLLMSLLVFGQNVFADWERRTSEPGTVLYENTESGRMIRVTLVTTNRVQIVEDDSGQMVQVNLSTTERVQFANTVDRQSREQEMPLENLRIEIENLQTIDPTITPEVIRQILENGVFASILDQLLVSTGSENSAPKKLPNSTDKTTGHHKRGGGKGPPPQGGFGPGASAMY